MSKTLTAVVTGANRGIGYETCRQLAERGYRVILTSRNPEKGKAAAEKLRSQGVDVHDYPLDVTSSESIHALRDFIIERYSAADVLVNDAAINLDEGRDVLEVELDVYHLTMETNLYGPLLLCQALIPWMKKQNYGRIVNVSSTAGQFADLVRNKPAYRLSKLALNGLSKILADTVRGSNILINSVHPGWVQSDMGGPSAPLSIEQGADTIVWLATLPEGGPHGGFYCNRKRIDW